MTLKTNANRQSKINFSCGEQPFTVRTRIHVPRLRRPGHFPGDFLAEAILFPASGDVNLNLGMWADDFAGVTPGVNPTGVVFVGGAAVLAEQNCLDEVRVATALDDDDEEDEDDEDADYDDDDLDEEDDEEIDDEEFEDDLDDEDDDLDDDDLDDEDDEDQ